MAIKGVEILHEVKDRSKEMIQWVKHRKAVTGSHDAFAAGYSQACLHFLMHFDKSKEPETMTLKEIAEQAKEGDFIKCSDSTDMYFDGAGFLRWRSSTRLVEINKTLAMSSRWKFSYRNQYCPHCGKVIDDA